jgi:hypothetical protein
MYCGSQRATAVGFRVIPLALSAIHRKDNEGRLMKTREQQNEFAGGEDVDEIEAEQGDRNDLAASVTLIR